MALVFRLFLVFFIVTVLSACSTMGPVRNDSPLNPLLDDIASIVIAFDLPRGLGPAPGSLFTFDAANGGPAEHLRLTPLQAEIGGLPASLPPPGADRAYYFFALGANDMQAVRDAQLSARQRGATAQDITLGFIPKLCTAGPVDPNQITVSIYAVLPGRTPMPFLNRMLLAQLLQQPGSSQMGPCG